MVGPRNRAPQHGDITTNFATDLRHNGGEGRPLCRQAAGVVSSREAACISDSTLPTGHRYLYIYIFVFLLPPSQLDMTCQKLQHPN